MIKNAALSFGTTRKLVETGKKITEIFRDAKKLQEEGFAYSYASRSPSAGIGNNGRMFVFAPKGTTGSQLAHELGHILTPNMEDKLDEYLFAAFPAKPRLKLEAEANRQGLRLLKSLGAGTKDRVDFVKSRRAPFMTYQINYLRERQAANEPTAKLNKVLLSKKSLSDAETTKRIDAVEKVFEANNFTNTSIKDTAMQERIILRAVHRKNPASLAHNITKDITPTPFVYKGK